MGSEWKRYKIENICSSEKGSIAIGPFGSRMKSDCYVSEGISVIRGTNISNSKTLTGNFVYITNVKAESLGNANVNSGDLVFPHRGSIGEVALVPDDGQKYVISSSLMKLTVDRMIADPEFVFYFFRSHFGKYELLKNASSVGTPGIGQPLTSLRSIEIPLPPLLEQKAIALILGSLDDKIELNRKMNETLEAMAQALFKSWFVDFDPVIDNAMEAGNEIPEELMERAAMRKIILDRNGVNCTTGSGTAARPSPPAPLPGGEGRKIGEGVHYRGGFGYSGLVEFARELRQRETDAEKFAWELLRNRKFLDLKFRRQHQIGMYIVDFYCDEVKLVLELDGGIHLEKEQKEKDAARNEYLKSEGFTVLRIWNNVVLEKTEEFLKQIETIVSPLPSHSSSSPSGRGRVREWKESTPSPKQHSPLPKRKQSENYSKSQDTESQSLPNNIKSLFPSEFEFTDEMGWVPKGWTVDGIGNEFSIVMGQSPPGSTYNEDEKGIPFFQGRTDFGFRYPTNRIYCTAPKRFAKENDTLVSVRAPVGDVNMAYEECCIGRGVAAVRHKTNSISFSYYSMIHLREHFQKFEAEGTVFGSINQNDFKALKAIKSNVDIVSSFEKFVSVFDQRIKKCSENIKYLVKLRDILLPQLLMGKIDIDQISGDYHGEK